MIFNENDIEKFKDQIKPELYNHPLFQQEWKRIYSYISELSGKTVFNLVISSEGRAISIQEQYVSKILNEKVKDNSALTRGMLYVDNDGALVVERSSGTSMQVKDYIDCQCQVGDGSVDYNLKKEMTDELSKYSSMLSTYYSIRTFDKDGIEMQNGYFSDIYPLTGFRVGDPLNEQVLSELHKPRSWSHNLGPELPLFVSNANYSYTYRFYENLGLSTTVNVKGASKYSSSPLPPKEVRTFKSEVNGEYPDILFTPNEGFAVAIVNPDQNSFQRMIGANSYEGLSMEEISKRVALNFEKMIRSSKTKEYSPSIYSVLEEKVRLANAKYKKDEEQLFDNPEQTHVIK